MSATFCESSPTVQSHSPVLSPVHRIETAHLVGAPQEDTRGTCALVAWFAYFRLVVELGSLWVGRCEVLHHVFLYVSIGTCMSI